MAKMQVFDYNDLTIYDGLLKNYINDADAKSLKTVSVTESDSNYVIKFYRITDPTESTEATYSVTIPKTDISGLIPKITSGTVDNVVTVADNGTVKDSGIAVGNLATKAEVEAVDTKADANTSAIEAINNETTGILNTAKTYADTKVKELADGQVKTNTDNIAKLNGDATTEGSVAKAVKDSADTINASIGTLADLSTTAKTDLVSAVNEVRAAVEAGGTGSQVTIDTSTTTEGYLKTYTIKQGTTEVGKIDIPKDLVVTAGEVVVNPDGQVAGTYIKLTIANQEAPIYINVADLVDAYTAQASATQIQLAVSDTNEISATIVAGSVGATELATDAVTTVKIADANVTKAKLHTDVQASLDKADSAVQSVVGGTANGTISVDGTDVAVKGLGSAAYTDSDAYDAAGVAEEKVNALANGAVATNTASITALQGLVGDGIEAIPEDSIRALFA